MMGCSTIFLDEAGDEALWENELHGACWRHLLERNHAEIQIMVNKYNGMRERVCMGVEVGMEGKQSARPWLDSFQHGNIA